ncbi:beta-lactamase/transpeptidase-like protein [Panaeolus papilionaceus]|nr:beta-lactamase/transpeptidase-like protein [Panaeolus papilionaceus]
MLRISTLLLALAFANCGSLAFDPPAVRQSPPPSASPSTPRCPPPSTHILAYHPVSRDDEAIKSVTDKADEILAQVVQEPTVDSIAFALVGPDGVLFEKGYGILRANETDVSKQGSIDRDSIYRIASISKMFTVLETLVLREKGVLNWDDPVQKYIPDFNPPAGGWAARFSGGQGNVDDEMPRITLRALASHMSGLSRDLPKASLPKWPTTALNGVSVPLGAKDLDQLLNETASVPLVDRIYTYPVYSNAGTSLLGVANVAANIKASADASTEPTSHKDLLKRDIFDPLGFNASFFRLPSDESVRNRIAVSSAVPIEADIAASDVADPAGGQYSSLADLEFLMQTLINPSGKGGIIPKRAVREWLRPLHVWGDNVEGVGAPWEIHSVSNTPVYGKAGDHTSYHTDFSVIPDYSYGVILLLTGVYKQAHDVTAKVIEAIHPAFQQLQSTALAKLYAGSWSGSNSTVNVIASGESLFLESLVVDGMDIVNFMGQQVRGPNATSIPIPLWSTGRLGEFRIAASGIVAGADTECFRYWTALDNGLKSNGAPIDLLYWADGVLYYPSANVTLTSS